ncbi:DUF445 domain-containing protein [Peribacillus frigoritolerans]|uniref:DUF445 domain-containing protein n=1 Tax=Peribacillus frigoritolerans TaxID=450367 RepID=UPI0024C1188A|nr:DUF445 domain-containing protein [Peribacillus frigoritolerans]MDM5311113.1 DUF445 domain-containing protein [Peribacillus frigoritolerans]WHX62507.1 DUF445 domain-containing protein [Peribacillus frigoritolerans]
MSPKIKSSRKIARYSLIIMGAGYIATTPFQGSLPLDLLHGGFEAGLVGGLADWFAVTALFRHPLGLPIPHTALLPNNRKRMTNALVSMLKNDWLSKESIQDKVKHIPFTEKLIPILGKEIQSDTFRKVLIKLIKQMIGYIDIEKITPFVAKKIKASLSGIDMSKILHLVSSELLNEEFDKKALDHILKKAEDWLGKKETSHRLGTVAMDVLSKIELEGMLQFAVKSIQSLLNEEKFGNIIQNLLLSVVNNLQNEKEPNREALILYIRKEIQGINHNRELLEGVEKWKKQLLTKWEPEATIEGSLKQIQQEALDFVEDEHFMDTYLTPMIHHILDNIKENSTRIDQWIQKQITVLIEKNHTQIGNLVQENLDKLDNETLIDMMENGVGKDLQWIRVNGAVCGFIIGLILTGVQALLRLL